MKVLIAQINPTIGDLQGNLALLQEKVAIAIQGNCDVVVFPELATIGYPPRDLLYSSEFWRREQLRVVALLTWIKTQQQQITVIVGGLHEEMLSGGRYARFNAAWILDRHFGKRVVHKRLLPCYDVFDETRYFESAVDEPYLPLPIHIVNAKGEYDVECDVLICEDIWNNGFRGNQDWMRPATCCVDPVSLLLPRSDRAPLFVLNGSPFWLGKITETKKLLEDISWRLHRPVVWVNQIGAHDDIITGGYSMVVVPPCGESTQGVTRIAHAFQEDTFTIQLNDVDGSDKHSTLLTQSPNLCIQPQPVFFGREIDSEDFEVWTIYRALFLHMMDYRRRCGFKRAVLGLSGGIDSAVVAVIAADVFGAANVTAIAMPSPYSSEDSVADAKTLAKNLGILFEVKPIDETYKAVKSLFLSAGKQQFTNPLTDENIQPRARAIILMAHSNEFDPCLLLTTGNKSEITVGYCTIYGDMCGGLAVLSDLPKTQVYELARFINKYRSALHNGGGDLIPENTIEKPASAELKPNQKDTDSLPPYNILDPLLRMFVEDEMTVDEVLRTSWASAPAAWFKETGNNPLEIASQMYLLYRRAEYKRQQMPPGPKIQQRSFGSGRRMPIAMKLTD